MAESRSHKATANRIAEQLGTEYNSGKGVDIRSPIATVEVETPETVRNGVRQLRGHRGPVYIAGTNQAAVDAAMKKTEGTTVGVMDNQGRIVRSSTRQE